jgi:hypothetical protein
VLHWLVLGIGAVGVTGRCCIVRSRVAATVDPGWSDRQGQLVEGGQDL